MASLVDCSAAWRSSLARVLGRIEPISILLQRDHERNVVD